MNVRRLFPSRGPGYELYDTCWLIFLVGFLGYVITDPSPVQQAALPPLRLVSEEALGWVLTAAGLFGMGAAYFSRFHRVGYIVAITAAGAMFVNYGVGALQTWEIRPVISVVFYGWITRRLLRDNTEVA